MAKKPQQDSSRKMIAQNRKARHNYFIEETLEAGIVLTGSEVKSLRAGKAQIGESYIDAKGNDLFLINSYIPEYTQSSHFNHKAKRLRKLLLHRREIKKLIGKVKQQGMTLVPLSLYFNERNKVKVDVALVKGKKNYDKRETEKKRDWDRQKSRVMKNH